MCFYREKFYRKATIFTRPIFTFCVPIRSNFPNYPAPIRGGSGSQSRTISPPIDRLRLWWLLIFPPLFLVSFNLFCWTILSDSFFNSFPLSVWFLLIAISFFLSASIQNLPIHLSKPAKAHRQLPRLHSQLQSAQSAQIEVKMLIKILQNQNY